MLQPRPLLGANRPCRVALNHSRRRVLCSRRPVTRSHKFTDRDHAALADGTAMPEEHLPRYFAKAGHTNQDPTKTKKDGGGKGNW